MNREHERNHVAVSNAKMRGGLTVKVKDYSDGRELRPSKISGWKLMTRGWDPTAITPPPESMSAWMRRGVFMISTLELAHAPDGSEEVIPQWHVSMSKRNDGETVASKRPTAEECRQALACIGMVGAEEDNHHPGVARHFWMPVDPARRVSCECKVTEQVIVEPDGYKWSTPKDDTGECHGCEFEKLMTTQNVVAPCPIHKAKTVQAAHGTVSVFAEEDIRRMIVDKQPEGTVEVMPGVYVRPKDPERAADWNPGPTTEEIREDLASIYDASQSELRTAHVSIGEVVDPQCVVEVQHKTCPSCKAIGLYVERRENDHGEYDAQICPSCEWESDTPEPQMASGEVGACEGCGLPIRDLELYMRWGDDVVTHYECPKEPQA
jgi:hypothetical protein